MRHSTNSIGSSASIEKHTLYEYVRRSMGMGRLLQPDDHHEDHEDEDKHRWGGQDVRRPVPPRMDTSEFHEHLLDGLSEFNVQRFRPLQQTLRACGTST